VTAINKDCVKTQGKKKVGSKWRNGSEGRHRSPNVACSTNNGGSIKEKRRKNGIVKTARQSSGGGGENRGVKGGSRVVATTTVEIAAFTMDYKGGNTGSNMRERYHRSVTG